jgi:hypothetical protein
MAGGRGKKEIEEEEKKQRMRWAGHVANMGEMRNVYTIFVEKPEGKRTFRTPRQRWEDNIRLDLQEIGGRVWTECIWLRIGTSGKPL